MTAILVEFLSPFIGYIVTGIVALGGFAAIWFSAKRKGKHEAEIDRLKKALENENRRKNLEQRVRDASDADFDKLQQPWLRR